MNRSANGAVDDEADAGRAPIERPRSAAAIVESVALTLAFPLVGMALDRRDPFFLTHAFPWIVFAPLLVGLRHGFAAACTSASLLAGALVVAWRANALEVTRFPGEPVLGLVGLAMLTGQYSDLWRRSVRQLTATRDHLRERARALARAHFLLELSHDRLVEDQSGAPSLRDALVAVQRLASSSPQAWDAFAERTLGLFAAHTMIEAAAILRVDGGGRPDGVLASFGRVAPVDNADALLVQALRTRELVYLPPAATPADPAVAGSRLLVVAPFVDGEGAIHAVLCVEAMPFMAFQPETLKTIAILAGHFGDLMAGGSERFDARVARATEFSARLSRALRDLREFGVPSTVAALRLRAGGRALEAADVILGASLRPGDAVDLRRDEDGNALAMVLLAGAEAPVARALEARIAAVVQRELACSLHEADGAFVAVPLERGHSVAGVFDQIGGAVRAQDALFSVASHAGPAASAADA